MHTTRQEAGMSFVGRGMASCLTACLTGNLLLRRLRLPQAFAPTLVMMDKEERLLACLSREKDRKQSPPRMPRTLMPLPPLNSGSDS